MACLRAKLLLNKNVGCRIKYEKYSPALVNCVLMRNIKPTQTKTSNFWKMLFMHRLIKRTNNNQKRDNLTTSCVFPSVLTWKNDHIFSLHIVFATFRVLYLVAEGFYDASISRFVFNFSIVKKKKKIPD